MLPHNILGDALTKSHDEQSAASAELTDKLLQTVADKRELQQAGRAVPSDKTVL